MYEEAMNLEDRELRKQAITEELQSMNEKDNWDQMAKSKARIVTRDFKDKNQYDLKETYTKVTRLSLIREPIANINK